MKTSFSNFWIFWIFLFVTACGQTGMQVHVQNHGAPGMATQFGEFKGDQEAVPSPPNLNREEDRDEEEFGDLDFASPEFLNSFSDLDGLEPSGRPGSELSESNSNSKSQNNDGSSDPTATVNTVNNVDTVKTGESKKNSEQPKSAETGTPKTPAREIKNKNGADDSSQAIVGLRSADFVARGELVPTVYYQPIIEDDLSKCSGKPTSIRNAAGAEMIRVCSSTFEKCMMQGSCVIRRGGVSRSFNVTSGSRGVFAEVGEKQCEFGFGVRSICLDPFYTVAADLSFYKPGDVIFVPGLVGWPLPQGNKHSGFLVVRDRGGAIKGEHRFDFFSGTLHYLHPKNPFGQAKLSDRKTRMFYYQVRGPTAQKVLRSRAFPRLP